MVNNYRESEEYSNGTQMSCVNCKNCESDFSTRDVMGHAGAKRLIISHTCTTNKHLVSLDHVCDKFEFDEDCIDFLVFKNE